MKKGEVYFNWIFILVVGAVFLAFFTGFAIKYKDLQEKKTEIIFLNNLDVALTNLQSSSFTTSTNIEMPLDVSVNCDDKGYSIFINENNDVDYIIASKEKLKDKIYIWYKPYRIPFQATNFYYINDDSPLNIFTNNIELVNSLKGEMPESFNSRLNVFSGNRFVVNGDMNKGTISIDGKNIPYFGREMLYATMLSNNYSCFYNNANREINKAISIYENKARILSKSGCNYNLILSKMNLLRNINSADYSIVEDIEKLNKNLISINCPGLF